MPNQSSLPLDLGQTLSRLRSEMGKKQSDISKQLKVDTSRVSRMETGDFSPSLQEIEMYLLAVGSPDAHAYLDYLRQDWKELPRPPFKHPNQEALWQAEQTLQRLREFCTQPDIPRPLLGQAEMYRQTLETASTYLISLSHTIAYVGDIGVGKTTFLSSQTGLMLPTAEKVGLQHRIALEVGSGGTTLCEVRIRRGTEYGIQIEPLEDAEIYKLVAEFCAGVKNVPDADSTDDVEQIMGVSREIERALRNMAGLARRREKDADGKLRKIDPASELAATVSSLEDFRAEVSERLRLWKRMGREIWFDPTVEPNGLQWIRDTFKKINNGLHPEFSLPKRIHVVVPNDLLLSTEYDMEIVDTKGVDKVAIRPDLQSFADDPRTLTVLCSRFNSAPDVSLQGFIQHIADVGLDEALRERTAILVLPRPEEALSTKDDAGDIVETEEEAYDIKQDQIVVALKKLTVANIPIYFSNINVDDPAHISEQLVAQLRQMRESQVERIRSAAEATTQLIANRQQEHARSAQQDVNKALAIFINQHKLVPGPAHGVHNTLIRTIRNDIHPRTVWASVRRVGNWANLDVYYYLGTGGASDVRRRTGQSFGELAGIVNNMLGDEDLAPVHAFLRTLSTNIALWRTAFLDAVRRAGDLTFRPVLGDDSDFWAKCEAKYGRGLPYRQEIAQMLEEWFEREDHQHLHTAFEDRVQKAWQQEVLEPLNRVSKQPTLELVP